MTPKFFNTLVLSHGGKQRWKTYREIRYQSLHHGVFTVPAGFETDLASIPRIFWPFLSPAGKYAKAAVLHDWLYVTKTVTRKVADELFLEAMEVLGVSWITRNVMYRAVRMGGGSGYLD